MTKKPPKNVPASVRARLLTHSRETGEDFQFVLHRYAAERFLYRLGESRHRDRYVLKGAMLLALWGASAYRPTRDVDFAGHGDSEAGVVLAAIRDLCILKVTDDGIVFDPATLVAAPIREDDEYGGLRIRFRAVLDGARIPMQIDVGFGNAIDPPPIDVEYPTLLGAPAPRVRAYPREVVVAEKLQAMVVLGERNSRYKDFYDVFTLARQFAFDGEQLARSIAATFERRRTPIDGTLPSALTPAFYEDQPRAAQWRAYLTRNSLPASALEFARVGQLLQTFLVPPWSALSDGAAHVASWRPDGPWVEVPSSNEEGL